MTYFSRWLRELVIGLVHLGREKMVPIVLTLVILLVQWRMKWIQSGDGWKTVVIQLLLPLGFFLAFYGVRAVVQLDKRKAKKITALEMILKEWPQRVELIKLLRGYHREGELLKEELERAAYPPSLLEQRTKTWRMYSANMLLQRRGEMYEERFNKIGAKPELTELAKLHNEIYELKKAMDEVGALVVGDSNQEG
jgi:hypothetical protein